MRHRNSVYLYREPCKVINVILPDTYQRGLAFFLAAEEWVAEHLPAEEYFFTWITKPTVIIGRHQDINAEVNLDYCDKNNIEIVRRRSGGGCVYSDGKNIMMSYICPDTDVAKVFARFTVLVAGQLQKMGFDAAPTGRNDITVGERKISGNAFYHLPTRSIVHGTMLYDTDIKNMMNAITPSKSKLAAHNVQSVEARIITARQLNPELSFEQFYRGLTDGLFSSQISLSPEDIAEVEDIEKSYYDSNWLLKGESIKKQKIQI